MKTVPNGDIWAVFLPNLAAMAAIGAVLRTLSAPYAQEPGGRDVDFAFSRFTRLRAQFIMKCFSVLRDPRSRMVVFVPPILQLLVFAFAATLKCVNVDIAVYDQEVGAGRTSWYSAPDSARVCITHVRHVEPTAAP